MCLRTQKRPKFEGEIDLPSQNKHSLSEMAVDVILSTGMEVNNNYVSPKILNNNEIKDTEKKEDISTPYERLANELINDERASKELSMGKRIGFYRVRGDLGSGNFSQVKMGFHCLTRGKYMISADFTRSRLYISPICIRYARYIIVIFTYHILNLCSIYPPQRKLPSRY